MIALGTNEISDVYFGEVLIIQIYLGETPIWYNVKSCYGGGGWDNNLGWDHDDGWKN